MKSHTIALALLSAMLLGQLQTAGADEHNTARALREAGEIKPLEAIVAAARQRHPGRLLEAELEREHGRYLYEIEIAGDDGIVWELKYDAASGALIESDEER